MARYHLDAESFDRELLNAPWMEAVMRARADAAGRWAVGEAPVSKDSGHSGRYRESFMVTSGTWGTPESSKHRRAYAELWNIAPEAAFVEFGTERQAPLHILLRAMDVMA